MAAEFGLGGFGPGQLKEIFDLFRELRLAAGDFVSGTPVFSGEPRRPDPLEPCTPRSPGP